MKTILAILRIIFGLVDYNAFLCQSQKTSIFLRRLFPPACVANPCNTEVFLGTVALANEKNQRNYYKLLDFTEYCLTAVLPHSLTKNTVASLFLTLLFVIGGI
jgi:hypothetical protein